MTSKHTQSNITKSDGRTMRDVMLEIERMKEYCKDHYNEGYDTMVECWGEQDFEGLFYNNVFGDDDLDPALDTPEPPRHRVPASKAWETLHSIASIYADQQADALNSEF